MCRVGSFAGNNRIHWADLSHHPFGQECTEPRTSIKIDPVADRVCFFLSPLQSLTSTIPITTYSGERFSSDPLLHPVAHSSVQFFIFFWRAAVQECSGSGGLRARRNRPLLVTAFLCGIKRTDGSPVFGAHVIGTRNSRPIGHGQSGI